jgi:ketopantoate hydroxymethyltransferase
VRGDAQGRGHVGAGRAADEQALFAHDALTMAKLSSRGL